MSFVAPGFGSLFAFVAVVAFTWCTLVAGVWFAARKLGRPATSLAAKTALGALLWTLAVSGAVASGAIEAEPFPRLPAFVALSNLVALGFALSPAGRLLATGLPLAALVGFQAFRLPLELVLHEWVAGGTIPATMTWTGQNFDVVSGVVALLAAPLASRFRAVAWAADLVGFALLANVARVALLSSPLPFAWRVEPPLRLAFHLPYAWIIPFCVGGALAGHVILTRALLLRRSDG